MASDLNEIVLSNVVGDTIVGGLVSKTEFSIPEQITTIPSGGWYGIPLDMTTATMQQIVLMQLILTQDFSLRAWVSKDSNGIPTIHKPIPVMKRGRVNLPIIVYTALQTEVPDGILIMVEPASYVLNVLNLTNEENILSSRIDVTRMIST